MENENPIKQWLKREWRVALWLAAQLGVDPATLSQWVTGRRVPLPHNREALHRVCGIDPGVWGRK